MDKEYYNLSTRVVIKNELGLHARAAARIANIAGPAKGKIWLIKDGEKVDASSIIDILSLGCSKGTEITISADSEMDSELFKSIILLAEKGFGE
jgi:phosphocarrier protein